MTIPAAPGDAAPDTPSIGTPSIAISSPASTTVGLLAERPDGDFLTLLEVAATLRTPVNTLRWWRRQGTGPRFLKIGRKLVTTVGDLTTWIAEQKHASGPDAA